MKRELLESELRSMAAISWEHFKIKFYDRSFMSLVRKHMAKEIANLVKGSMTVE